MGGRPAGQRRLGLDVPDGVIEAYEAVIDEVDLPSIRAREAVTRHDVKARIDEFCALAGHQHIHRGMTSRDLTENVEQLQVRESLELIRDDLAAVLAKLADRAELHAHTTMVARTHNAAAQATTLGKRFADAAEEVPAACERLDELLARYPLRGIKGPVGTRADQLDWAGSAATVDELEREVVGFLGFDRVLEAGGQVYPRSLDLDVVSALGAGGVRSGLFGRHHPVDGRPRAGFGGVPARSGRVLGHAPQGERPVVRADRSPADVLDGHLAMAAGGAGRQWNEGDVSCSAVRRVMLPDSFFTADGLLHTALAVLEDLEVFDAAVSAEFGRHLADLSTARLLTALVATGLGRETAHELISEHARAAARARRAGEDADLIGRLAADARVPLDRGDLDAVTAVPAALAGTAVEQTARVAAPGPGGGRPSPRSSEPHLAGAVLS